ncbi:MAG: glycoside hydrolase family 127 protein [Anaeromyxobacter sp.]
MDTSRSPYARVRPVPVNAVRLDPGPWGERYRLAVEVSLPALHGELERHGRLDGFRRAAGQLDTPRSGLFFDDSDVYKWLEAAAWALAARRDPALERLVGETIALVERAQEPDGYLDTFYAGDRAGQRWSDLRDMHELYCGGHLVQAAIAHHRATGDGRLLAVAVRWAEHIWAQFAPEGAIRRSGIDGHQEVELALVELTRETGDPRWLRLARHFLEARGHGLLDGGRYGREYYQDHLPFRELPRLAGHAVRALYYCCGVTDLHLETGDASLRDALTRLWEQLVSRQLYVSGGAGSRHEGESLGDDHELPNARAYTETCAAIASVMWNQRMLAATGEARHADLLEWTLLNGVLPGWSLDGLRYFYVNPLQADGSHQRKPWYTCACCPPNVARTLTALPGYLYGTRDDGAVLVHQYAASEVRLQAGGAPVTLVQRTAYPWDGRISVEVRGAGTFALHLRIPGWCEAGARLTVNGQPEAQPVPGTYAVIHRSWTPGDRVELELPMPVRLIEAHPHALEDAGRVALARGPLLYCVEGLDHPGVDLRDLAVDPRSLPAPGWRPELLGGVVALQGAGAVAEPGASWSDRLYRTVGATAAAPPRPVQLQAIPYFAWANRAPGQLQVWLRRGG